MASTEQLKKEIDTSGNEKLEIQEMEEFLKSEENIKKLGEAMNSSTSPELLQELENTLKNLCEKILSQTEISDNQQKILDYFINNFGDKYPELKEKIKDKIIGEVENGDAMNDNLTTDEEINENTEGDISPIQQEIDSEIDKMLQSVPLNNLQDLGINISQQDKKSKGIRWIKVKEDIKKVDDLNKITEDNINQYITIPNNIPKENYAAITENVKQILYRHLQLHPERKTVIGNEGYSTGMSLEDTRKNDKYEANLHNQLQKLQKRPLDSQVDTIVKNLPNNSDLLDLWLKTTLNSKKNNKDTIIQKFFDKIPSQQSEKFFKACEKNKFINELKNSYAQYRLIKNNCIKTGNGKYCFLDWMNKSKFENFKNKGIELKAGNTTIKFDDLYNHTQNFYESVKKIGLDATIPIENMLAFEVQRKKFNNNKKSIDNRYNEQVRKNDNPYVDALGQGYSNAANLSIRKEKIMKISIELDKEYAKLLLLKKPKPTGRILGISGAGVYLDFSKGNNPEKIVRDSFREQLGDQRENFKQDLKNDRQAAFGSAMGMVGGIAGSAGAAILSGNILITSAGFTAGLRLGNGVGQELWNSGEFLYEQTTGNTINDGNNKVEDFGQGFLRGVGVLDQNYEYVGTTKFLSGLGFDYLSTVATFGLSQKFGGFLGKLEGVKFAGGALKFGMEELILENFFVDIPMNIVQTGFETFTGIDNGVTVGNTAIGNQHTVEGQGGYKSGSLSDMLRAMKDAGTQNLSFENLSQTFFNTVIYGGFLEGGGAAIKKMKGYLPSGQVSNFTERSAAAATAFAGLTNFMSSKNINFNKDGICIDTKTNLKIEESDPRFKELTTHIKAVEATKAGVIESFETIMETQRQMVADPENKTGLLFRLGLISPTNTPLNILKKKKELVEKKLNEAKAKGDNNKVNQLQKLLDIYTDAETKLNNSDYFDGKSKKLFEGDGTQARGNSEMMDNLLNEVNKEGITETEITEKLGELRKEISEQYKQTTGEDLNLTDEQLLSVLDAHEQDGILGELTIGQLKQKVKVLQETITDPKVRRFLLEAGFCGKAESITQVEYSQTATDSYTKFLETNSEIKTKIESGKFEFMGKNIEELYKKGLERALEGKTESEYETIITNYNSEFLNNLQSLYKKMEENYTKFTGSNPEIQTKIESGKFEFMGKNIEELYKKGLYATLEGKPESQHESLIFDFNTRFANSLEFLSDKESSVKFLDSKTGKLVEGTITDYGKSLLGENFESSPTKKAFFDKLKASMFYQHLDNPLKYCSHGADHSILVDRYVQNIVESYPDVVNSVIKKYFNGEIDNPKSQEGARQLLRLTAVFHDFGYPDIGGLAKAMHGPFGGAHFINEFASSYNSTFTDFIKNDLGITDQTKIDQLINDMRDAIFFHSADKVEKGYLNKIKYTKGTFLLGDDFSAKGTDDFIEILNRESDGAMTITYRSKEGRTNAENFKKMMLEKYPNLDGNKIKIEEDSQSYDYDNEFDYKKDKNGEYILDKNGNKIRLYEYHGRKGKTGDSGIEFQPIDLLKEPLAGIVRLADNMDMSLDRLTRIQSHPIFMNLFYNIGYNYKLENGEPNKQTASYIYQQMEKLNKIEKKKQIPKEEYDNKSEKDKEDYITPEEYKTKHDALEAEIKALIIEANNKDGIEMTIFDERTGKPKEGNSTFRAPFNGNILKPDGKVDLYTYKQFIINETAKHVKIELNDPDIQTIQNIAIDNDIGSYSFRHFIGLTPIKDVTLENSKDGNKKMIVKVDKDTYLNPYLWSQRPGGEKGFDDRPVVEYHIRRLYDASGRVAVDGKVLDIEIVEEKVGDDGEIKREVIGRATRTTARDQFRIEYKVSTPDGKRKVKTDS